jgi:tripartite ATP-independent transporter DctP family solute receptor
MTRQWFRIAALALALAGLAGSVLFGAASPVLSQQPLNYRLGIVVTRQALGGEFATTFIETAKQRSNGRINVELFDRAQLGGETEMMANLRTGELDFAILGSGIVASVEPTFSLTELPFIWRNPDHVHQTLDGAVGQRMMGMLEPKGIKGLVFGEWGYRELLIRNKAVNGLADVKGLKVRVIENPLYVATWRAVAANPVPMAWPEVYTGLQQGTIDAVDTNPIGMRDAKLYEVAKNLAVTHHIFTALVLMMNLDKWKALPPDLQKAVMDAAKAGQEANRKRAAVANEEAIEVMKQNGVKVTQPDAASFREAALKVHNQFKAQVGPDLLKLVQGS